MEDKKLHSKKFILAILLIIFIVSLIPLYYIGIYDHPSSDDYSYGIRTSKVWEDTHSMQSVIKTAIEKTTDKYYNWQGNFSAIFLMYLQPGIFGEKFYCLTPFLLLTSFILCSLFFYFTVFRKVIHSDRYMAMIASILLIFVSMQFIPVPSDSFYWYNGGIYYTFFYSLSLLLYASLIWMYQSKQIASRALLFLFALFLSFFIGGGNYATALLNAIILFFVVASLLWKQKRIVLLYLPVLISGMSALIISILGPGNTLRQSTIGSPNNPVTAILLSFVYGGYSLANTTSVPVLLFWFLLIPIFWDMTDNTSFHFKKPLLVLLTSFCIYSAQITPVIYAQGIRIPYRIRNIVYFNYYVFIALNVFYFMGYLKHKRMIRSLKGFATPKTYYLGLMLAIIITTMGSIEITESSEKEVVLSNLTFTSSAVYSLVTKEAQDYDAEVNERIQQLLNGSATDIVFRPFEHQPNVLFHSDITDDENSWKNRHLAQYYRKKTVRLSE